MSNNGQMATSELSYDCHNFYLANAAGLVSSLRRKKCGKCLLCIDTMTSTTQQEVREAVEAVFDDVLRDKIEEIVARAQEADAAKKVAEAMWPALKPEDLILLDRAERGFLERAEHVPPDISEVTQPLVEAAALQKLAAATVTNKYARGAKLKGIVRIAVQRRGAQIREAAHRFFERKANDRFADATRTRELVIKELFRRMFTELQALGASPIEDEPKRRLKTLTALGTPGSTPAQRAALLMQITDGKTASFPYILKYLSPGEVPVQLTFAAKQTASLGGFTPALNSLVPEASLVMSALDDYLQHNGVLSAFMPATGPVMEENAAAFERLPDVVQRESGGLYVAKEMQLARNREERYRLPDGIVCAVGATVVLESLLRHAQRTLGLPASVNARGHVLATVLASAIALATETQRCLSVVFGGGQMALRDAVAHGAFVANDEDRIQDVLGGLMRTLALLVDDLNRSPQSATIFAGPHYAAGERLDPAHEATFEVQHTGNLNLFLNPDVRRLRTHCFQVLARLIPDKSLLGRSAVLIWADLDTTETAKLTGRPAAEFVGIVAGLIALEELFRAIHESYGHRVLIVAEDSPTLLKCELSILDTRVGRLLDPARLADIFGVQWSEAEFQESVAAVIALRNAVLHGGWASLTLPKVCYLHLVVKLIMTLCASVSVTLAPMRNS